MKMGRLYYKQKGIGLLELMLSLAIIAVLLVMATRYYQSAHRAESANQGIALTQAIVAAAANYKAGNDNYANISMDILCDTGMLPNANCLASGNHPNPYGGQVSLVNQESSAFTVKIDSVPQKVCNNLILKFHNYADTTGSDCPSGTFQARFLESI